MRNERAALAVLILLDGEYGDEGVHLGMPCIVGKNGVEHVIELDDAELEGVRASAALLVKARTDLLA